MTRNENVRRAKECLENSKSYREFKMKLDLCGVSLYNIDVIRAVRSVMFNKARHKNMRNKFTIDIKTNIDKIQPVGAVDDLVVGIVKSNQSTDKYLTEFEHMILAAWMQKYTNTSGE